jgi:hypothetical protein
MPHHLKFAIFLVVAICPSAFVFGQDSDNHTKNLDIRSSAGDLHLGDDADAKRAGLPLYPGARMKSDNESQNKANLSLLTDAFGMKLVVANYTSDDAPGRVIEFYRHELKKYGKVLECHSDKHGGDVQVHTDDKDSLGSKELKCNDSSGPVTELKVGTENDQHIVSVEPGDSGKGSTFALVYVHTRGKRGEI